MIYIPLKMPTVQFLEIVFVIRRKTCVYWFNHWISFADRQKNKRHFSLLFLNHQFHHQGTRFWERGIITRRGIFLGRFCFLVRKKREQNKNRIRDYCACVLVTISFSALVWETICFYLFFFELNCNLFHFLKIISTI